MKTELEYVGLQVDISIAQKVTVELRNKVKVFRKGFGRKLKRAKKLTATLAKRDQLHAVELALKAKELEDCEAAMSLELERRKRLDADCSELWSQLSTVDEQLITARANLLETEATVQQLEVQTDDAFCMKVDQCLRGYVECEIHTLK